MPETYGLPEPTGGIDPEREARVRAIMKSVSVGGLHLSEAAANEVATNPNYIYFVTQVDPQQWAAAASVIVPDEDGHDRTPRRTLNVIMNRLSADGPDPRLVRWRPGLTPAQWRSDLYDCYLAARNGTDEDEDEDEYETALRDWAESQRDRKPVPMDPVNVPYSRPVEPRSREKEPEGHVDRSEHAATLHSTKLGLPKHRRDRLSQLPGASRTRRQVASGLPKDEYDRLHPPRGRQRT